MFRRRSGRLWCRARSGSTGFRRRFRRRSGSLWCRARSSSTGSGKVPEKVWEALAQSQVKRFRRRFRQALMQRQVRFNRVREKVPRRRSGRLWCRARSSSTGVRRRFRRRFRRRSWESLVQGQVRFNRFRRRFQRRLRRSLLFFFLFSCMCTRHTCMSLEPLCFSESFLRFVLIMPI